MPGTLFVVATPIGNLEDITMRALRVLRDVRVIACEDTRRTAHLLRRYAIDTPTTSLHEHNERRKAGALLRRLEDGDDIALVSDAGTPTLSDPGQQFVQLAIQAGIRIEPIPGASALSAALSASGFAFENFLFLGFPPTKPAGRRAWIDDIRSYEGVVVFFEAPHRVLATLTDLLREVGDCGVSVGRELTKAHEELIRGRISDVLRIISEPVGEYTIVVDVHSTPNQAVTERPSDQALLIEFGQITDYGRVSRRQALQTLARRHGMTPNEVYKSLESAKKSVE
jgi:16S rRNA (cytidine1402-2'-O)-methyltransferase